MQPEQLRISTLSREQRELTSLGKLSIRAVLTRARSQLWNAAKQGRIDQAALDSITEILAKNIAKTNAVAHMKGMKRALLLARPALQLSTLDATRVALERQLEVDPDNLEAQYQSSAFRIARGATLQVETQLRQALNEQILEQRRPQEALDSLRKAFDSAGLFGVKDYQLEAIYATQASLAYNAGQWNVYQSEEMAEIVWGFKYVTVGDVEVRPEHVAMDKTVLPKDDPFWITNWPPNGWNCRCVVIPVMGERKIVPPKEAAIPDPGFNFNAGQAYFASPTILEEYNPTQTKGPQILQHLIENPGQSNAEIAKQFNTTAASVASIKSRNKHLLVPLPPVAPVPIAPVVPVAPAVEYDPAKPKGPQIIEYLRSNPTATSKEVAEKFNTTAASVASIKSRNKDAINKPAVVAPVAPAVGIEYDPTKPKGPQIIEYLRGNPAAKNADVAAKFNTTAASVASIKSTKKALIAQPPTVVVPAPTKIIDEVAVARANIARNRKIVDTDLYSKLTGDAKKAANNFNSSIMTNKLSEQIGVYQDKTKDVSDVRKTFMNEVRPSTAPERMREMLINAINPAGTTQPLDITLTPEAEKSETMRNELSKAVEFLGRILGPRAAESVSNATLHKTNSRAFARITSKQVHLSPVHPAKIYVHELGHLIERRYLAREAAQGFRAVQTEGQELRGINAGASEVAIGKIKGVYDTRFSSAAESENYAARVYPFDSATEVISMGLQQLYENPQYMAQKNPEYFDFLVNVLRDSYAN